MLPRPFLPVLLLAMHAGAVPVSIGAEAARPLNVVFILADDLGQRDLGCYGSTFYETPAIDRLAREGVRCTDAYAACPVCSPTRASILTGRHPQRTGVTDFIGAAQPAAWIRNTRHLPAPYAEALPLGERTLAEILHDQGYATFFAGKWHLGGAGSLPEDQGFDVNPAGSRDGGPGHGRKHLSPYAMPSLPDGPSGDHLCERLAAEAGKFIDAHAATPFLVYLPLFSVHVPLMTRPELERKYAAKRDALATVDRFGSEPPRAVRLSQDHAVYAGMVETLDDAVKTVLDALDRNGLTDRTLVVLTSDNGGLSTAEGSPTANAPWRAGKGWLYEGGIRVPALARLPGRIPVGTVSDLPITSADWLPTILDAAGLPVPANLDGSSSWAVLTRAAPAGATVSPPPRPLFWHYPHYGNQGGAPGAAIRVGDWKLIEWFDDDRVELFDLEADPGETTDLAARAPERVAALRSRLHDWQRDVGAVASTPNPRFDPTGPDGRAEAARGAPQPGAAHPVKPGKNVLFIVSDDLNTLLGCYGDPLAKTPHIDALARRGVLFERAYCTFPLCGPSRNSFLTGLYPNTTGILANAQVFRQTIPEHTSLPELFRRHGGFAARVGKLYHFNVPASIGTAGHDDPASWEAAFNPAGVDRLEEEPRIFTLVPGSFGGTLSWHASPEPDDRHTDGILARQAEQALAACAADRSRPFFLAVGFFRPHTPYVAPRTPYFEMHPREKMPVVTGVAEDQADVPPAALGSLRQEEKILTDDLRRECRQAYNASISFMDAQVGRVVAALDRLGLADDTVIVFTSDHGYHMGEHGLWQKMSLFEESCRVPLVVVAPGVARAGTRAATPVSQVDLYPTLAELCGLAAPANLQGQSLVPTLRDPTATGRGWAISQVVRGGEHHRFMGYSLRTTRWRYTEWDEGRMGRELYDHDADPLELENLAADPAHADDRAAIARQLAEAVRRTLPAGGSPPPVQTGSWPPMLQTRRPPVP